MGVRSTIDSTCSRLEDSVAFITVASAGDFRVR